MKSIKHTFVYQKAVIPTFKGSVSTTKQPELRLVKTQSGLKYVFYFPILFKKEKNIIMYLYNVVLWIWLLSDWGVDFRLNLWFTKLVKKIDKGERT